MAVVPNAKEKTISLPTVPIAAMVLLILFLVAARFGKMPRGLATAAGPHNRYVFPLRNAEVGNRELKAQCFVAEREIPDFYSV